LGKIPDSSTNGQQASITDGFTSKGLTMLITHDNLSIELHKDLQEAPEKGLWKRELFEVFFTRTDGSKKVYGHFCLEPMPGCCGVVVSTSSQINEEDRGTSIGPRFHGLKEKVARHFGYSLMLSTVQLRNLPQVIGGSKAGWKYIYHFRNKRTDNDLTLGIKELK
jgi:hypothetical protein